jgi:transcription initiation factor IIE alpha subunit
VTASSIGTYLDIMGGSQSTPSARTETAGPSEDIGVAAQVLALVIAGKGTVEEITKATGLGATDVLAVLVALANARVAEFTASGAELRAVPSESIAAIAQE